MKLPRMDTLLAPLSAFAALAVLVGCVRAATEDNGRTAGWWLAHVRGMPPEGADAGLEDLRRGCTLEVTYRPMFKPTWDAERRECLQRYRRWVAADGEALIDQWLRGEPLADNERPLLPIVKATYMYRARNRETGGGPRRIAEPEPPDEYVGRVVDRGERALREGFLASRSWPTTWTHCVTI